MFFFSYITFPYGRILTRVYLSIFCLHLYPVSIFYARNNLVESVYLVGSVRKTEVVYWLECLSGKEAVAERPICLH